LHTAQDLQFRLTMETFDITVEYRGELRPFHGRLDSYGFSYRIIVEIDGREVIFEPDEERNLRAVLLNPERSDHRLKDLVRIIGDELQKRLSS